MEQTILIKYIKEQLNIGLVNWREAWLFSTDPPQKLYTEVHKGKLSFRIYGTSKRFSYLQIKKGLIKREFRITEHLPF